MIKAVPSIIGEYPIEIVITEGMYRYFLTIDEAEKLKNEIEKIIGEK